jgi:hypothetical protein
MKPLHSVVEQQIDNYISEEVTIADDVSIFPVQNHPADRELHALEVHFGAE